MNHEICYVGVDVSKKHLDLRHSNLAKRFPNTGGGHRRLIRCAEKFGKNIRIICEPSGGYERRLVQALWESQTPVSLVNAAQVRNFARATGRLAKTDKLDAEILQRYGATLGPRITSPKSENQRKLSELATRRQQFLDTLLQEKHRSSHLESKELVRDSKTFQKQIQKQIQRVESLIDELLKNDPQLARKVQTLIQVKGIGKTIASLLVAQMPELGTLSREQVAALVGVAPFNRESGSWQGQSRIYGGRFLPRKALYMAAIVGSRRNPILKAFYDRLIAKGKPPKKALIALMRKLIIHLNSLLKQPHLQPTKNL